MEHAEGQRRVLGELNHSICMLRLLSAPAAPLIAPPFRSEAPCELVAALHALPCSSRGTICQSRGLTSPVVSNCLRLASGLAACPRASIVDGAFRSHEGFVEPRSIGGAEGKEQRLMVWDYSVRLISPSQDQEHGRLGECTVVSSLRRLCERRTVTREVL